MAYIDICLYAVNLAPCDIFIDTMGVGFGYPLLKILYGVKIYSYTHYPIVSKDMINDVKNKNLQFNNKI